MCHSMNDPSAEGLIQVCFGRKELVKSGVVKFHSYDYLLSFGLQLLFTEDAAAASLATRELCNVLKLYIILIREYSMINTHSKTSRMRQISNHRTGPYRAQK